MKATERCFFLFVISTLLMLGGCEKAEIITTQDEPTGDGTFEVNKDSVVWRPGERDGSRYAPFTAGDLSTGSLGLYLMSNDMELDDCWVEGYIVGYITGTYYTHTVFDTGNVNSNVVLADRPDEDSYERVAPVQLSSAALYVNVRKVLNLADNPWNMGHKVMVRGKICKYMGTVGVKNTIEYLYED